MNERLIVLVSIICLLIGCRQAPIGKIVQAEIQSGMPWKLPLTDVPITGGLGITKHPHHAKISDIRYDKEENGLVYYYLSEEGFQGTEQITVTLEASYQYDHYFNQYDYFIELKVR